ncbi:hypothetical protein CYL18_01530 [Pradoshia eiseniae]|uniref:Uncharacterized protein n=1 Tax=Pradoshia eiseniae TaxID=2064768 RepID=A0A2S7N3J8_9BACI|nr:hypothetical protein [Pradoshia eiseniae]PQD96604.1 hypothetical protein CYL18_01530 [Pradoshia eiseniae]
MGEVWEKPGNSHPMPMLHGGWVGERWEKAGKAMQSPPNAHASWGKDGRKTGRRGLSHKKLDRKDSVQLSYYIFRL